MYKILVISYNYAPDISPRAFRWSAIVNELLEQGHKVDVISAWRPNLLHIDEMNGGKIYRVGGAFVERLREYCSLKNDKHSISKQSAMPLCDKMKKNKKFIFGSKKNYYSSQLVSIKIFITRNVQKFIKYFYDYTWKKIYWPDYTCLWYFTASRYAKGLVATGNYDILITVSHPFTGHLVGLRLKKFYPHIHWLVDIGDPFYFFNNDRSYLNNSFLFRKINFIAEKKVLFKCDFIVVTSHGMKQGYIMLWPDITKKINVIYPLLYSKHLITQSNNMDSLYKQTDKHKILQLIYTGTFYKKVRNPALPIKYFRHLIKIFPHIGIQMKINFYGSYDDASSFMIARELLNNTIHHHGVVSHDTAINLLKNADILLHISNNLSYVGLPSKIVEYIAAAKPILNFYFSPNDESVHLLTEHPLCLNIKLSDNNYDKFNQNVRKIALFLEQVTNINSSTQQALINFAEAQVQQFIPKSITAQYLNIYRGRKASDGWAK